MIGMEPLETILDGTGIAQLKEIGRQIPGVFRNGAATGKSRNLGAGLNQVPLMRRITTTNGSRASATLIMSTMTYIVHRQGVEPKLNRKMKFITRGYGPHT